MVDFFRKQLFRSINLIKTYWKEVALYEEDEDLTIFGQWFMRVCMFILFAISIPFVICFIPLLLAMMKYDEEQGY